jgi:hypothetical protein
MSRELAVPDGGDLADVVAQRFIAQMRAARQQIGGATADEASKAKRDAEVARHWAKVNKASSEIALEACKLQACALRRLGALGAVGMATLNNSEKAVAAWFAEMDGAEFGALMNGMRYAKSPHTLRNEWLREQKDRESFNRGRDIAEGGTPADPVSVTEAAREVLNAAMAGGATTVNELTMELAKWLDLNLDRHEDRVMREGVESIVREALRCEDVSDESHPDFVTWKDREAGWLRIPWPAATLDQLRWMAEFRQEQARELQEAADTLAILVRDLDAIRAGNPRMSRLNDLWAALQDVLNAEDEAA